MAFAASLLLYSISLSAVLLGIVLTPALFDGDEPLKSRDIKKEYQYCDLGRYEKHLTLHHVANSNCIPCPKHGVCENGVLKECAGGFRRTTVSPSRCISDAEFPAR